MELPQPLQEEICDLAANPNNNYVSKDLGTTGFKVINLKRTDELLRKWTPRLLGIPQEMRDIIYRHALISHTSRWETRHQTFCKYRDRTSMSEEPPFTTKRIPFNAPGWRNGARNHKDPFQCVCSCECPKRHAGLNVLRVNRQIFQEASRVFYGENTFHFDDGYEFVGFFNFVRPELRNLVTNISIVGSYPYIDLTSLHSTPYSVGVTGEDVWSALRACEGLKTLELRPEHVEQWTKEIVKLWTIRHVDISISTLRRLMPYTYEEPKLKYIWIKVSHPLHKTKEWGPLRDQVRQFHFESVIERCRDEIQTRLLNMLESEKKSIDTTMKTAVMTESYPPIIRGKKVLVLGLPSSIAQRLVMRKEELRDEKKRKANGMMSRAKEVARIEHEVALKERQEVLAKEDEEAEKYKHEVGLLNKYQAAKWVEEEEEKAKANQKRKLNRKIKRAEEEKKKERKRVPGA